MRYIIISILFFLFSNVFAQNQTFKEDQLRYQRVRTAYAKKGKLIDSLLLAHQINGKFDLFIRILKTDDIVETWVKGENQSTFQLLKKYTICKYDEGNAMKGLFDKEDLVSGKLGPKRKQGDRQIPEGFYYINLFNPSSQFYLSLQINYPNASDIKFADKEKPGSLIFIHGDCVSIGCVPIEDENIMELYVLAVQATSYGQEKIPVHIFPTYLNSEGLEYLNSNYGKDKRLIEFWNNLTPGYNYFEENKKIPTIKVNSKGRYELE